MKEGRVRGLVGFYNKSVILTYIGIALSILGIVNIMNGYLACEESLDRTPISMICFILAGICDLFDGFIARKCKRTDKEKEFGIQIDSLADVVSFLVFPVVLLSRLAYRNNFLGIVSAVYVVCGIIRLAYFNITTEENKGFFRGLPVTFSAVIIPLIFVLTRLFRITEVGSIMIAVYGIIAILFIVNFKIKKPTGVWYIIFPALAIFTIYGILVF